jgi:hypothetical protein
VAADQLLTGPHGRVLARYELRRTDDGRPYADLLTLERGVEAAEAVPAILAELRGHRVGTPPALGNELVLAGALQRARERAGRSRRGRRARQRHGWRATLRRRLDRPAAIGLAVTHANPARARYAAHGFAAVLESLSVDVG